MDNPAPGIGHRIAKGALWTVLMRMSVRSIGLVSTIVLARLLLPGDFGLVALAAMLIAFIDLLGDLDFDAYLIREQELTRAHYDTAWTMSAIKGAVTTLVLILIAPFLADWFNDARLEDVVYVLAFASAIGGVVNVGVIDFQRSLTFDRDFRLMVWPKVFSAIVTISLAFLWRDYWALVAGVLTNKASRLVLSYVLHPFRPRPDLTQLRTIFRFSKWLLANNILQFVGRRSDTAIIGKILETSSLGIYTVAQEISELATAELLLPIQRALFPGLAQLAADPARIRKAFIDSLGVIAVIGVPVPAGIGLIADPLVRLALGPKWLDAIPVIQILAIVGVARVFSGNSRAFLLVTNRPHLTTVLMAATAVLTVALLPYAVWQWGIIGAGWASVVVAGLLLLLNYAIICRICAIPTRDIGRALWRPVVACAAMAAAVGSLVSFWPAAASVPALVVELASAVLLGAASYGVVLLGLWRLAGAPAGAEQRLLGLIRDNLVPRRMHGASGDV